MKHNWTQNSAIAALKNGAEIKGNVITVSGVSGLAACSAIDYLKNHCGFTVITAKKEQ